MTMPTLTLIRGLPGSGKSTLANLLAELTNAIHAEADSFFLNIDGHYIFDPKLVPDAHEWCKGQVRKCIDQGYSVVVANTFTMLWEIEGYEAICPDNTKVIKCVGNFSNTHNVPDEVIKRMAERWEDYRGEIQYGGKHD